MEWTPIHEQLPEEGREVALLQADSNVIDIEEVYYIGFHTKLGHQFVNDDISDPIYYLNVTAWKYR